MEELIRKYKLAKAGDMDAVRFLLSIMGDGLLLKKNPVLQIEWYLQLVEQGDENSYKELFLPVEMSTDATPLYIEPKFMTE